MNFLTAPKTTPFGPSGQDVYDRTYSRIKDDGTRETWPETVRRVVDGNLGLVDKRHIQEGEREALIDLMENFAIIPAGRHLWLSGVPGKQFINNCWVSGWTEKASDHFAFTFDQLMQGGGVGANYSNVCYSGNFAWTPDLAIQLHLVCDPDHPDYEDLKPYLSDSYTSDSIHAFGIGDTREHWVAALTEVIDVWQRGVTKSGFSNPLIYDLSRIRASGKKIKTFGGTSAGPVPLAKLLTGATNLLNGVEVLSAREAMELDHVIAECVVSGNVRRSARMSILHWDHPDIEWFIQSKSDWSQHWSTNISVEVDDRFFEDLEDPQSGATKVFNAVTEGMYKNGEPGFWNSSLSNVDEPNPVEATNPCGEITLPAWGVCNLGHVNLDYFADKPNQHLALAHVLVARFLVRATFADIPRAEARTIQDRDRRIGVGHFGYHGFVAKRGVKYSESWRHEGVQSTLNMLYNEVRDAARAYSYELRIPEPVKVTTVAPTGTIAKMPGRSEGIHPIFSPYFLRRIRFSTVDSDQAAKLEEYKAQGFQVEDDLYSANTAVVTIPSKEPLVDELEELGLSANDLLESAYELRLEDQLGVQAMYQTCYADNAVSYTVNFDPEHNSLDDLRSALRHALPALKGTTVFPVTSRPQSPYEPISKAQFQEYAVTSVLDGTDEECSSGACPIK